MEYNLRLFGPLTAFRPKRRGVWRSAVCVRADMATTLGLFSRLLGLRDADLSGPRYICGRGVSKNYVSFLDARIGERAGQCDANPGLPVLDAAQCSKPTSRIVFP